ncbi:hypothetical protein [Paraflavitalea sp. CAU 1676]|uniref:hypothetical protein n=1 Tax=Paraflavitalea sp. CAU 1676 TaxID=3032598 RepID=UPI0023DC42B8|nr:hypothetical protein [Paraflavitalea sp. CAU 1676]MDF2192238.1 hypothetical protein [Paraflavitalea sp. CAU 1676]
MKNANVLLLVLFSISLVAGCKKGDTGPEGPAGPAGTKGNADVALYNFGQQTFTGSLNLLLSNLSQGKVDSSLILVYYNPSTEAATAWYPIPGSGPASTYETRFFVYQSSTSPVSAYTLGIRTTKADGTVYPTQVTWRKVRVIIAPASVVAAGGRQIPGAGLPIDVNDYAAVCRYFNIGQ